MKKIFDIELFKSAWTDIRRGYAPDSVYVIIAIVYVLVGGMTVTWLLSFVDDKIKDIHTVGYFFISLFVGITLLSLTVLTYWIGLMIGSALEEIMEWLRDINVRNGNGEDK